MTIWFKLRILALGLLLGFSNFGEVAHAVAHERDSDHHAQHHTLAERSIAAHETVPELDIPDLRHDDPAPQVIDGVRFRAALVPEQIGWEPDVVIRNTDAEVWASAIEIKIHPRRGPPPRLRAPPTV